MMLEMFPNPFQPMFAEYLKVKAEDARRMTQEATAVDEKKAIIVLGLWHDAIRKAAAAGRTSVRESQLDRVRTPIPASAYRAAREQLAADGFTVKGAAEGPNEGTFEVSW